MLRTLHTSSTALAGAALLFAASQAHATASISCTGIDDATVSADIGFGSLPVLSIISARFSADGTHLSLNPQSGETPIANGDAAFLDDGLIARFTDTNINEILVELRIISKSEGKTDASVGMLTFPGKAVYGLSCEGP